MYIHASSTHFLKLRERVWPPWKQMPEATLSSTNRFQMIQHYQQYLFILSLFEEATLWTRKPGRTFSTLLLSLHGEELNVEHSMMSKIVQADCLLFFFAARMRGHPACVKSLAMSGRPNFWEPMSAVMCRVAKHWGLRSGFHDSGDFLFRVGEEIKDGFDTLTFSTQSNHSFLVDQDIVIQLAGSTILFRTQRFSVVLDWAVSLLLPGMMQMQRPKTMLIRTILLIVFSHVVYWIAHPCRSMVMDEVCKC